jgi:hypothetical protein
MTFTGKCTCELNGIEPRVFTWLTNGRLLSMNIRSCLRRYRLIGSGWFCCVICRTYSCHLVFMPRSTECIKRKHNRMVLSFLLPKSSHISVTKPVEGFESIRAYWKIARRSGSY